jgi:hypothetical protein
MTSDAPLVDRLRILCDYAQAAGADRAWLATVADDLVALVLAQTTDPRRRRSRARAAQMANVVRSMCQAGHTNGQAVEALCRRHGLRRSWVYELLQMSGDITGHKRR